MKERARIEREVLNPLPHQIRLQFDVAGRRVRWKPAIEASEGLVDARRRRR
jgi:hypothetical protein